MSLRKESETEREKERGISVDSIRISCDMVLSWSSIWIAHKRNWWQLFRPLLPPLPPIHRLFFFSMVYFRPLVFYSVIWMNLFIATSSGVIETWLAKTNPGKFNCKFTKKKQLGKREERDIKYQFKLSWEISLILKTKPSA